MSASSYLELQGTLRTTGIGGFVFDQYGASNYKYVALDVVSQQVLVGHVDPRRGWVVDAAVSRALTPGADYAVELTLNGTSVSVVVNGTLALSFGFNASIVDGAAGVLSRSGTTSFNSYRIRTSDPGFTEPAVSIADASGLEGATGAGGAITLTLTLSKAATTATAVSWSTTAGTAAAGGDYAVSSGTVSFAPGATTAQVTVALAGDTTWEPSETFLVVLASPSGLPLTRDYAVATLVNDDATISVASTSVLEGDSGTKTVTVTVTLSNAVSATVTVSYATAAGTATAGADYLSTSGTLSFSPGVVSRTFTVTIVGDRTQEANETFQVNLSSPAGAAIATGSATVTILDNDSALTAVAAPSGARGATLTQTELSTVMAQAKALWHLTQPGADLAGVSFAIADLDGPLLARTWAGTITLDATAAGWGWGGGGMDLLTVVLHELGHALGLEHDDDGLMGAQLAPGKRWGLDVLPVVRGPRPGWIRSLPRHGVTGPAAWRLPRHGSLLHRR